MSRTAEVLKAIYPEGTDVAVKLNITPLMLTRIMGDDRHVRPWLMRTLIDKHRVNPLYIYGTSKNVFLDNGSKFFGT
jgi:hypothetical protein